MLDEKEFPSWIGCVALKEIRQLLRRGLFIIPFAVVHILAIVAVFLDYFSKLSISYFDHSAFLNPAMFSPFNQFSCGYIWCLIPICCIIVIPLVGISTMSQEMHKGNSELLMLTSMRRDRVIIQKFLALWSLSLLMLCSLLPYALVPYWINGMRIVVLVELIFSVVVHSAVTSAMVIAISGYVRIHYRLLFLILFGSIALLCLSSVFISESVIRKGSSGWHYFNGSISALALVLFGLASAKSQLKLTLHFYEMKPTNTVCILMFFSPVIALMAGTMSMGFATFLGFLGMALLSWFCDEPTKSKKELARKKLNIPEGVDLIG